MGFFDFLLGEGPSSSVQTLDRLTPEQKRSLNALLGQLGNTTRNGRDFGGDVTAELGDLAQTSLAGLENRAAVLSDPNFENEVSANARDTLFKLLDFEGQRVNIDDVFTKTVQDPLVEDFTESILPQIGRSFGGANFFSGERARADDQAREDLLETLGRERSRFSFSADQAARDRALQALGLSSDVANIDRADTNELLSIFGAGMEETGLQERNISREFQQFLAEAGLEQQDINQFLAAIGMPAIENVVTQSGGSSGLLPGLLGVLGQGGGFGLGGILDFFKKSKQGSSDPGDTGI